MHVSEKPSAWVKWIFGVAIALTVGIFLLNFALVGFGVFGDGIGYYTPLRSLIFDGDLRVANEYEFLSHSASNFGGGVRVDKEIPEYSKYTIGLGLMLSPFFLLGHGLASLLAALGLPVTTDGLSWPYELIYCLGSISLGILGLLLCYVTARRFFSQQSAAIAVLGVWFASPLTFYLTIESSMSHAVSQFLISSTFYLCLAANWRNSRKLQCLIGLLLGLATLVRPQDILFFSIPLTMLACDTLGIGQSRDRETPTRWSSKQLWRDGTSLATVGAIAILLQIPQVLVYIWQYGGLSKIPYLQEGAATGHGSSFNWLAPNLFNVLFSGFHGLFSWHPLLLLGIAGVIVIARHKLSLGLTLLVPFLLQVYLIGSWWSWWQGSSFGGRMFASCSLVFVVGLAALWDRAIAANRRGFWLAAGVTAFFALWNGLLVLQYKSAMIPSEADVPVWEIYRNQFLVVPFFIRHVLNKLNG